MVGTFRPEARLTKHLGQVCAQHRLFPALCFLWFCCPSAFLCFTCMSIPVHAGHPHPKGIVVCIVRYSKPTTEVYIVLSKSYVTYTTLPCGQLLCLPKKNIVFHNSTAGGDSDEEAKALKDEITSIVFIDMVQKLYLTTCQERLIISFYVAGVYGNYILPFCVRLTGEICNRCFQCKNLLIFCAFLNIPNYALFRCRIFSLKIRWCKILYKYWTMFG